jgi:hypothetical protein
MDSLFGMEVSFGLVSWVVVEEAHLLGLLGVLLYPHVASSAEGDGVVDSVLGSAADMVLVELFSWTRDPAQLACGQVAHRVVIWATRAVQGCAVSVLSILMILVPADGDGSQMSLTLPSLKGWIADSNLDGSNAQMVLNS